jgi:ubiquinone biosynthesis protein UbiJ
MKNDLFVMVAQQTAEIAWLCDEVKALRRRLDKRRHVRFSRRITYL